MRVWHSFAEVSKGGFAFRLLFLLYNSGMNANGLYKSRLECEGIPLCSLMLNNTAGNTLEQGDDTSLCLCKEWVSYKYTDLKQMPRIRWQKTHRLCLFIIAEPSVCWAAQHTHLWEIFSVQVRAMDAISCCENVSILSSLGSQLCSFVLKEGLRAWLKSLKELL